jgi:hypothetical protein
MKLRNKRTGEIGNLNPYGNDGRIWVWIGNKSNPKYRYNSLAELNEEWEDYEEPEVIYYISWDGVILHSADKTGWQNAKQIGNYFETKEEAEKAVEKLKAWKRLKDKGFKFCGCHLENEYFGDLICCDTDEYIEVGSEECKRIQEDYDFLFGGEE